MARDRPLGYVCDWLPPDFGAIGQYAMLFARERAECEGREVVLIGLTSAAAQTTVEQVGAGRLTTVRLTASPVPRDSLARRLSWTLKMNARLAWAVMTHLPRGAEVVFTGAPPFMIYFMAPLRWLRRYSLTYRITDFHPECVMAGMERVPAPLRFLHRVTIALRRRMDRIEVIGEDQRRLVAAMGVDEARIGLKRDPSPVAITRETRPLPLPQQGQDKVVLLYSGNFGVAHDVDTLVDGYVAHHREGSGRVILWLNAVGGGAEAVAERLAEARCPLIRGKPVPLADLPALLVTPHAHLITLRDAFVGLVLPSKVYGCVASGRDILFIGSSRSDVHLVSKARVSPDQAYLRVDTGDSVGLQLALEALADRHQRVDAARPAAAEEAEPCRRLSAQG